MREVDRITRQKRRSVDRGSANSQIVTYTEGELRSNPGGARERYFVISVAPRLVSVPAHAHPRFGRFSSTGHDSAHYRRQPDLSFPISVVAGKLRDRGLQY